MINRLLVFVVFMVVVSAGWALAQVDEEGLGLAESLLRQNRPDDAEKLAQRALIANPESLEARLVLAKVALTKGDLMTAQDYTDQLMEADPNLPDHHALQGMVFMFADQLDRAIESLQKALELGQDKASPEQMASYSNTLVLILYKAEEYDQALGVCVKALQEYPQDPDLFLSCSRLYRDSGDFQAALEVAQQGLNSHPDFPGLYASVALAQAGLGDEEASEAAYQQLLQRDPDLAKALRATLDGARPDDPEYQLRTR